MIGAGLAVLRGGPVGAIGDYALNQVISTGLSVTGLDGEAAKLVTLAGKTGLSILDSRSLDDQQSAAEVRDEGVLVEAGSTILGITALGGMLAKASLSRLGAAADVASSTKGFSSFSALKRYLGSPGEGNQWHHIVEQTPGNLKAFGAEAIHSPENVIAIPATTHIGSGSISAYYSSKQPFTNGLTVRQWLAPQSLSAQSDFGLQVLKDHGQ